MYESAEVTNFRVESVCNNGSRRFIFLNVLEEMKSEATNILLTEKGNKG
jgi:hypothetical protein